MHDLFNPAGLSMLEDQKGAVAYGFVAPQVFYVRFVGQLSAELGTGFVRQLESALTQVPSLAYFADASALREYDLIARLRFVQAVVQARAKFTSLVLLTWAEGIGPAARAFADALGEPLQILTEPLEFERALANVAPLPTHLLTDLPQVWQIHAPA